MLDHLQATMTAKIDSHQMTPMNVHRTCVLDCCYVGTADTLEHADREWLIHKGKRQTAKWLRSKPCFDLAKMQALEATQTENAALIESMMAVPPHAQEEIARLNKELAKVYASLRSENEISRFASNQLQRVADGVRGSVAGKKSSDNTHPDTAGQKPPKKNQVAPAVELVPEPPTSAPPPASAPASNPASAITLMNEILALS